MGRFALFRQPQPNAMRLNSGESLTGRWIQDVNFVLTILTPSQTGATAFCGPGRNPRQGPGVHPHQAHPKQEPIKHGQARNGQARNNLERIKTEDRITEQTNLLREQRTLLIASINEAREGREEAEKGREEAEGRAERTEALICRIADGIAIEISKQKDELNHVIITARHRPARNAKAPPESNRSSRAVFNQEGSNHLRAFVSCA